jgi:hypothetical protein
MDVSIYDTDSVDDLVRKLVEALNHAHELKGPVMIHYRGQPYAMVVPPDAGLAWARAEEAGRLSGIASKASGLFPVPPPGKDVDHA